MGPPALRPSCTNGSHTPPLPVPDDGYMHIAFFDTRGRPGTAAMVSSAEQIRRVSGASAKLRFHALLRAKVEVPGMTLTLLEMPPVAECMYSGLARLSHGPSLSTVEVERSAPT